ncbi:MAG: ATP-binding protein [Malacoplasma sp.]|nr:ATP-binding protein [Malacoplasma sp.]
MNNYQTAVGTVISVTGNNITVQLSDTVKSNSPIIDGVVYRIGQIGSFLKIPLGYCNLYGIVTQIGASAIPPNLIEKYLETDFDCLTNQQWLTMSLIGEQIGTKFERGVSQSPTTGDAVHLVTISDLKNIYSNYNQTSAINVGNISTSESLTAFFDLDKLVSRHFAILGSTGSGKSNAVGVTLNSIIEKNFKRTRIIILDPHGEYNTVFKSHSTVFKVGTNNEDSSLFVPYWALPFNELISLFEAPINDLNKDYFRSKIIDYKILGAKANGISIDPAQITADSPIPFSLKQLWFDLDDFERQTYNERGKPDTKTKLIIEGNADKLISNQYEPASTNNSKPYLNNQAKGILSFLDAIRFKLKDSRYDFLFNPGCYTPDLSGKVSKDISDLLESWIGSTHPISIFDLSDVPSELMLSISGTLLNIVYDALFWGQNLSNGGKSQPLLIVLEEAHNYLHSGENSIASRTVQRIAKEGRKYGAGLLLVTQRPSELDETVLSQCGTIIALRMNNNKDRGFVTAAIQDELKSLVDILPSLRTGEAIVSGEGVKIPSRIQFYKLANASKGADPSVSEQWNSANSNSLEDYKNLVTLWRNKKFNLEE